MQNGKTDLGKKINFVNDIILKNQSGERTSQTSFQKMFQPITAKLDDISDNAVIGDNKLTKRKRKRKGEAPNYNISVEDEIPDYEFEGLFD